MSERFPRTFFRANENISLLHLDRSCFAAIRDRKSVARNEASRPRKGRARHAAVYRHARLRGLRGNRGKKEASTTRTIYRATVKKSGGLLAIEFVGDGYLYKMVRMMVGAIVEHATGKIPLENISQRLASPRQASATRLSLRPKV